MQLYKQASEDRRPTLAPGRGIWMPADPDLGRAVRQAVPHAVGSALVGGTIGAVPGAAVGLLYGLLTERRPGQSRSRRALAMTAKGALGGFLGGAALFGGAAGASEGRRAYDNKLISSRERGYRPPSQFRQKFWESTRRNILGSGFDDDIARSVLSTYSPDHDHAAGKQPLFNRAIDAKNVLSGNHLTENPYRVRQEEFGPEVVFSADEANDRLDPAVRPFFRVNPYSPEHQAMFMRDIGDGDPFIHLGSDDVRTPITYGHEYTHFRDPVLGPIKPRRHQGLLSALVEDTEAIDKRVGGRLEREIPALTTENVIAMRKERETPSSLEARGDAARGGWIYDHMLRHGPQISDDPQLTVEDRANIRGWIEDLRNDPVERRRYENWLRVQTGKDG